MAVPVRSAATVLLVCDGMGQGGEPVIEVCILRRNLNASFAAGAHVFPGGSVDLGDRDPELGDAGYRDAVARMVADAG